MSYSQNGTNGYSNGYGSRSNRYGSEEGGGGGGYGDRDPSAGAGAGRRARRAGGYGGFPDAEPDRTESQDPPPRQERRANGHTYNRSGSSSNRYGDSGSTSSNRYGDSTGGSSARYGGSGSSNRYGDSTSSLNRYGDSGGGSSSRYGDTGSSANRYGDTTSSSSNRYGDSQGGSGGGSHDQPPPRSRDRDREPTSSRTRDRLRPSQNESRSKPDARMYGDGPAGKQLEDVVDHINEKWSVLTKADCVPVQIALQLMDTSSLGRGSDYEDFRQTGKAMYKGLKAIVNEHHQGFNSSIGTFHKIQSSIQASQERVGSLKDSLMTAKANLTVTRAGLKGLAISSQSYDDMLQVLGQIEKIQALPEQLDARISEKQFLAAVDVLQEALRLIRHSSLENIGALADLRLYLNNQETSLSDILLEELHDHLYLKSPYTLNRWNSHPQGAGDVTVSGQSFANTGTGLRSLYRFLTSLNMSQPMVQDLTRNPEEDSFEYVHMLIEALNKMGRLELAVENVEQRLPVELNAVVEKTNQEVDQRHPPHLRASKPTEWTQTKIRAGGGDSSETVLTDLLYTLYSKFEAIAEGHRAVHEVISGIIQRERIKKTDTLTKGFRELWKLYQSEMRSLLHDYLATDGSLLNQRDASGGAGSIFKRNQRDRNKRVFKMGDLDRKQLSTEQDELDKILQSSVPGLVSKSSKRTSVTAGNKSNNYESASASHKLLVEPSVFNISVLLPPSLIFLQRLKETVPPDSDIAVSTLTSFLDDFLVNIFTPQLDDTVTELCTHSFVQMDAFQEDSQWSEHSQLPIFKGAVTFYTLIQDFCRMLDNIPQDQMFTTLLLNQLKTYHDRCVEWSESLLSRVSDNEESQLKPAAATVKEGGEIVDCLKTLWSGQAEEKERSSAKLMDLLMALIATKPIGQFDTVADRRTSNALCLLYSSLQWLSAQLNKLRFVIKKENSNDAQTGVRANRWTALSAASMRDGDHPIVLPLTEESVVSFDQALSSYTDLAQRMLFTLQLDLRLRLLQAGTGLLDAPYLLEQPVNEPDRSIMQLNDDLLTYDEAITTHLPEKEKIFLTTGLGTLLDSYMVVNCAKIKSMNTHGCERMQLNILVLQQNLKTLQKDVMLSRSARFFEYFMQGPKAIVNAAKETGGEGLGFSLDEFKTLVELCYSEALQSELREVQSQAKRNMGEDTLQLTEYMWSV